ncbi:MAG: hypothetical protein KatS3mg110_4687 [Pirellulaceae bacterium]|nr:MAG: hypothetical protein KatS3mg110_1343 [Pirellulaceae bacterium]GIW95570.1 MAG: hypothetical protein KatS3mg110_3611 [Pirellulaceae bacterium]GIW96646.1 MAG: hypothetical protein KatS3mg110_4687 [Pirellulaceae bacterium]
MWVGRPVGLRVRRAGSYRDRATRMARGIADWWWRLEDGGGGFEVAPADAPPTAREPRLQRLEAVLFLAREPLSSRRLAECVGLQDGTEARMLVRRLNRLYDTAGRAFRVEEVAGGFQLLTRPKFASWLRRLGHVPAELRLSPPVLETLAVIAYRQPVLRADIEAIRGVNCGEILRQLMDRQLIRICGRSDELGRPYLYGTTRKFLQVFGLANLDKLPPIPAFRDATPPTGQAGEPGVDGTAAEAQNNRLPNHQDKKEDSNVTVSTFHSVADVTAAFDPHRAADSVGLPLSTPVAARRDDDEDYEDEEDFDDYDEGEYDDEEDEYDDEDYDEDEYDEDDYDDEEDEYEDDDLEDEDIEDDDDYDDDDEWESVDDEEDFEDDDWEDDDEWEDEDEDDDEWD